jgi:hypothetical protein
MVESSKEMVEELTEKLTYEELRTILEELAQATGYYD